MNGTNGDGVRITGITAGAVLLALVLGSWGYTYKVQDNLDGKISSVAKDLRETISSRDSRGDTEVQRIRSEMDDTLTRQWAEMLRLYKDLREELLRSDQLNDEQIAKIMTRMDTMNDKLNDLTTNLKVLLSDKPRR